MSSKMVASGVETDMGRKSEACLQTLPAFGIGVISATYIRSGMCPIDHIASMNHVKNTQSAVSTPNLS